MSDRSFFQQVYRIVAEIPEGKVSTYGRIAAALGNPRGARTVGWAMKAAPEDLKLPCHRVINSSGVLAPEPVFGGKSLQRVMLESEGVVFLPDGRVNMKNCTWEYPAIVNER